MDFVRDPAKNEILKRLERPTFEQVVEAISEGRLIADVENPSPRHEGQYVLVVRVDGYVHYVPYRELGDGTRFLITVIPSRKLNKSYGGDLE